MDKKSILKELINKNNGYLITSQAIAVGITKPYMANYIRDNNMEKVAHGIYISEDVWPDELFIMQTRNSAVIFSGETALYLHGLIDREYSMINVTVPANYNATHLKADNVMVHYASKETYNLGLCSMPSSSGNLIQTYDAERCICDLIIDRKKTEVQNFQIAMKDYMSRKEKKLSNLITYAERLNIRDEVMKYVEVLV